MRAVSRQLALVAALALTLPLGAIAVARLLSYTLVEVVFFAVPLGFVAFLCWHALQYHVVRIGEDFTEWDAPVAGDSREAGTHAPDRGTERDATADGQPDSETP